MIQILLSCTSRSGSRAISRPQVGEIALLLPDAASVDLQVDGEGSVEVRSLVRQDGHLVEEEGRAILTAPERVVWQFRPDLPSAALRFQPVVVRVDMPEPPTPLDEWERGWRAGVRAARDRLALTDAELRAFENLLDEDPENHAHQREEEG
jgi:hypothetical protein